LRLKALRDAIEDYEYLAILDRLGRTAEAEKIVLPLAESFFRWNPDPAAYEEARAKLAALILSTSARTGVRQTKTDGSISLARRHTASQ